MGNKVNLVNVSQVEQNEVVLENISAERIDLVYEELSRTLSIRIKYSAVLAETPLVSRILHFSQPILQPENAVEHRPTRRVKTVAIGTSFVYQEKLFRVVASDGIMVSAVCIYDGEQINMTNGECRQIIMSNIG